MEDKLTLENFLLAVNDEDEQVVQRALRQFWRLGSAQLDDLQGLLNNSADSVGDDSSRRLKRPREAMGSLPSTSWSSTIVTKYLLSSPQCTELMSLWNAQVGKHGSNTENKKILSWTMTCLSLLLQHTIAYSKHCKESGVDDHALSSLETFGRSLATSVLRDKMNVVHNYITAADDQGVIKATLRILQGVAGQSPSHARELFQRFNFSLPAFVKLMNKTGKPGVDQSKNKRARFANETGNNEDDSIPHDTVTPVTKLDSIRSLFVRVVVALLETADVTVKKLVLDARNFVGGLTRLLPNDEPSLVILLLDTLYHQVLVDRSVGRKAKVSFFNGFVMANLVTGYGSPYTATREHVHWFLESLLLDSTLCPFDDLDSIMSSTDTENEEVEEQQVWPTNLKLTSPSLRSLARTLGTLRPADDANQLSIMIRLLNKYPILSPFTFSSGCQLVIEPKLSLKWISNVHALSSMLQTPLPDMDWKLFQTLFRSRFQQSVDGNDNTDFGITNASMQCLMRRHNIETVMDLELDEHRNHLKYQSSGVEAIGGGEETNVSMKAMCHKAIDMLLPRLAILSKATLSRGLQSKDSLVVVSTLDVVVLVLKRCHMLWEHLEQQVNSMVGSHSIDWVQEGLATLQKLFVAEVEKRLPDVNVLNTLLLKVSKQQDDGGASGILQHRCLRTLSTLAAFNAEALVPAVDPLKFLPQQVVTGVACKDPVKLLSNVAALEIIQNIGPVRLDWLHTTKIQLNGETKQIQVTRLALLLLTKLMVSKSTPAWNSTECAPLFKMCDNIVSKAMGSTGLFEPSIDSVPIPQSINSTDLVSRVSSRKLVWYSSLRTEGDILFFDCLIKQAVSARAATAVRSQGKDEAQSDDLLLIAEFIAMIANGPESDGGFVVQNEKQGVLSWCSSDSEWKQRYQFSRSDALSLFGRVLCRTVQYISDPVNVFAKVFDSLKQLKGIESSISSIVQSAQQFGVELQHKQVKLDDATGTFDLSEYNLKNMNNISILAQRIQYDYTVNVDSVQLDKLSNDQVEELALETGFIPFFLFTTNRMQKEKHTQLFCEAVHTSAKWRIGLISSLKHTLACGESPEILASLRVIAESLSKYVEVNRNSDAQSIAEITTTTSLCFTFFRMCWNQLIDGSDTPHDECGLAIHTILLRNPTYLDLFSSSESSPVCQVVQQELGDFIGHILIQTESSLSKIVQDIVQPFLLQAETNLEKTVQRLSSLCSEISSSKRALKQVAFKPSLLFELVLIAHLDFTRVHTMTRLAIDSLLEIVGNGSKVANEMLDHWVGTLIPQFLQHQETDASVFRSLLRLVCGNSNSGTNNSSEMDKVVLRYAMVVAKASSKVDLAVEASTVSSDSESLLQVYWKNLLSQCESSLPLDHPRAELLLLLLSVSGPHIAQFVELLEALCELKTMSKALSFVSKLMVCFSNSNSPLARDVMRQVEVVIPKSMCENDWVKGVEVCEEVLATASKPKFAAVVSQIGIECFQNVIRGVATTCESQLAQVLMHPSRTGTRWTQNEFHHAMMSLLSAPVLERDSKKVLKGTASSNTVSLRTRSQLKLCESWILDDCNAMGNSYHGLLLVRCVERMTLSLLQPSDTNTAMGLETPQLEEYCSLLDRFITNMSNGDSLETVWSLAVDSCQGTLHVGDLETALSRYIRVCTSAKRDSISEPSSARGLLLAIRVANSLGVVAFGGTHGVEKEKHSNARKTERVRGALAIQTSIVQHPSFMPILLAARLHAKDHDASEAVVESTSASVLCQVLLTLTEISPKQCPRKPLLPVFLAMYGATLSHHDRVLRRLIHLYAEAGLSPSDAGFVFATAVTPDILTKPVEWNGIVKLSESKDSNGKEAVEIDPTGLISFLETQFGWVLGEENGLSREKLLRSLDHFPVNRKRIPAAMRSCLPAGVFEKQQQRGKQLASELFEDGETTEELQNGDDVEMDDVTHDESDDDDDDDAIDDVEDDEDMLQVSLDFEADLNDMEVQSVLQSVYDPSYLMPLLCQYIQFYALALLSQAPVSTEGEDSNEHDDTKDQQRALLASSFPARKLVEVGAVGYAVVALSSSSEAIRKEAYSFLQLFGQLAVQATTFRERVQVVLVLRSLRGGVEKPFVQLPSTTTKFVAEILSVQLRPGHAMYSEVNSFLLQRPSLDVKDISMFYATFNSGSPAFRSERHWLLRLLCRGTQGPNDLPVLRRRHVVEAVLSLYGTGSNISDVGAQQWILKFLQRVASVSSKSTIPGQTNSVVRHHGAIMLFRTGFLPWCLEELRKVSVSSTIDSEIIDDLYHESTWLVVDPLKRNRSIAAPKVLRSVEERSLVQNENAVVEMLCLWEKVLMATNRKQAGYSLDISSSLLIPGMVQAVCDIVQQVLNVLTSKSKQLNKFVPLDVTHGRFCKRALELCLSIATYENVRHNVQLDVALSAQLSKLIWVIEYIVPVSVPWTSSKQWDQSKVFGMNVSLDSVTDQELTIEPQLFFSKQFSDVLTNAAHLVSGRNPLGDIFHTSDEWNSIFLTCFASVVVADLVGDKASCTLSNCSTYQTDANSVVSDRSETLLSASMQCLLDKFKSDKSVLKAVQNWVQSSTLGSLVCARACASRATKTVAQVLAFVLDIEGTVGSSASQADCDATLVRVFLAHDDAAKEVERIVSLYSDE